MQTLTTNGIRVMVETFYQTQYSRPLENKYIFAYRITIENHSNVIVQLMRRHWHIVDANSSAREIEGEGVVGQQPILEPGDVHQYISWAHITTDMGKMFGTYLMQRQSDGTQFKARIPEFDLIAPFKHN